MDGVIRLVVADDHPIWRSGIRTDLGDGFDVVGEAADAGTTITAVRQLHPDVVLCDLHMPGGGGIAVAEAVAAQCPVVILTVSESERDVLDAVAAGAVGYLVKSARPEELRAALVRSAAGEPVFSPQLAALLIGEYRRLATGGPAGSTLRHSREFFSLAGFCPSIDEHRLDRLATNGTKVDHLAARPNGGKKGFLIIRKEKQEHRWRRLFKRFQQRFLRGFGERFRIVDDH